MQRFLSKRFEIVERFRRSRHGFSFLGKDGWSGKTVFVKLFPQSSYQTTSSFQEQLAWYHGLDHPLLSYILSYIRYAGLTPKQDLYVIRDWYINGHVLGDGTVNEDAAASSLVVATELLRSEDIVHGRIKPSNIWIHEGGLKLLDGGVPPFDSRDLAARDFSFIAPEILSGTMPNLESDLYSVGEVLYLVYSGRTLFEDSDSELLRHKCIHAEATPLSEVADAPQKLSNTIKRLVSKTPSERVPAFDELLEMFSTDIGAARRAPLSGRRDELRRATTTIDATRNHLRIVAIDGEAGTGKTRLVEEIAFRHELIHGHFLTGRSYERLPLPELVAESSLYLASHHLEDGVPSKAHEYISKSVSTIETLAAQVPASSRKRYLKVDWRVEAQSMFKKIDSQFREAKRTEPTMTPPTGPLNKTLYTATVAMAEAKDPKALVEIIRKTVSEALEGRVVVSLTVDETMDFHAKKLPIDDALARRISKLYDTERERPYYRTEPSHGKKNASSVIASVVTSKPANGHGPGRCSSTPFVGESASPFWCANSEART